MSKGILSNQTTTEKVCDFTSDHMPVLLTLSSSVSEKPRKCSLINEHTDWEKFTEELDRLEVLEL